MVVIHTHRWRSIDLSAWARPGRTRKGGLIHDADLHDTGVLLGTLTQEAPCPKLRGPRLRKASLPLWRFLVLNEGATHMAKKQQQQNYKTRSYHTWQPFNIWLFYCLFNVPFRMYSFIFYFFFPARQNKETAILVKSKFTVHPDILFDMASRWKKIK